MKDAYEKGSVKTGDYCNQKITFLQRACDPEVAHRGGGGGEERDTFGGVPFHWSGGQVPNVLVAPLDRQPLDPETMEAFGDFCLHHLGQYFQWRFEMLGEEPSSYQTNKQVVMHEMRPQKWSAFLAQWQAKRDGFFLNLAEGVQRMGVDAEEGDKVLTALLRV